MSPFHGKIDMFGFWKNNNLRNVCVILQLSVGKNESHFGFKITISLICILWRLPTQGWQMHNNTTLIMYMNWSLTQFCLLLYFLSLSLYFLDFYSYGGPDGNNNNSKQSLQLTMRAQVIEETWEGMMWWDRLSYSLEKRRKAQTALTPSYFHFPEQVPHTAWTSLPMISTPTFETTWHTLSKT